MSVLEMSAAASVLIVAIIIVRGVGLYRLPKKLFLCLWGIAALRLLVPVSIPLPSSLSVDWNAFHVPADDVVASPGAYTVLEILHTPAETAAVSIPTIIWLAGICACGLYFSISYFKCRKEFKTALPVESAFIDRWLKEHPLRRPVQVWQTDRTKAPLTYGIVRPVILLPKQMDLTDEISLHYVLTHEYVHIRHFDALTKLVLTIAVCCHWFNPLVWVMYLLANRDIELICDETVVKSYEPEGKSAYALTLIHLEEIKSRTAIVTYFSRNFAEERVTAIMKTKKYTLPVIIVAFCLVAGAAAVFAADTSEAAPIGHDALDHPVYAAIKESEAEKSEYLRTRVYEEFGVNLNELSFLSFSYLWSRNDDTLAPEHEPLKTFLIDEFITAHEGEGLPDGVYYNDTEAYVARQLKNNQIRLVHCRLSPSDAWKQGERDEEGRHFNGYLYTVVSVAVSE